MCDIDRELVMRAAAHFATYAAEREPPKVDDFMARLIARALRSHVAKVEPTSAPPPEPKRVPVGDMTTAMNRARELIMAVRPKGSPPSTRLCKLLVAMQAQPDRSFTAQELAVIGGYPNPNKNGALHGVLGKLLDVDIAEKEARGLYKLGPKGHPQS